MTVMPANLARPSLTEQVQPLLESIREAAPAIESARRLPDDLMGKLVDAGMARAMTPAERGGGEADLQDWLNAVRLLARADMATGWVTGLLACHSNSVTYFDPSAQDEVWATGPDTLVCSSGAPIGKVERVEGGVLLSGRYGFSSGSDFCAWTMVGFILEKEDTRQRGFYQCLAPSTDYRIEDDWYSSGLRGTGSKSVIFDKAFIPEHRWFGPGMESGPLAPGTYKNPMFEALFLVGYNAPFGAIVQGAAEGALDAAIGQMKGRMHSVINDQRTSNYVPRQIRLGEGALQISAAAAQFEKSWRQIQDSFRPGRQMTMPDILWWRGNDAFAARQARAGVDHLMNEAGGSSQYSHKPLQRFWRDIHTACEHPWFDLLGTSHILGRGMLGLEIEKAEVL